MAQLSSSGEWAGQFIDLRAWRRRLIVIGVLLLLALIVLALVWNMFFVYVRPGEHLIIINKDGSQLPSGQVLAEAGQKGIQREVLGEGWHFVMPILYETEKGQNTEVPPGKVGIVTAKGGKPQQAGHLLAEEGEQGIQRQVLTPGVYRINKYGFDVEIADAIDIPPGYVGVRTRLLGTDGKGQFAEGEHEKGVLREVLSPGLYYVNIKEFDVTVCEVGIFQTSFHFEKDERRSTAITFTSKGGFAISLDCTVEWEILPNDMPELIAEYGNRQAIERNVIDIQAHAVGRDKGTGYGVQDFLTGSTREKFQDDFTHELVETGRAKHVTVHSAFIRNIVIPEEFLKPIREKQIAGETEITNNAKEEAAQSYADVEREQQLVTQRVVEVESETQRLVANIDREVENVGTRTEAEVDKLKAEYAAKIAALDALRTQLLGGAEAEALQLTNVARSSLYQAQLAVFGRDSDALLRYLVAEQLNPKLVVRLFHSGPGTFWTNMEGKGMNFLLPAGGAPATGTVAEPAVAKPQPSRGR